MKAFVSYSFLDNELYIITLLFEQLRKSGYSVETSISERSIFKFQNSAIFIGIITNNSKSINHVLYQWKIATANKIDSIFIVEKGVSLGNLNSVRHIVFNRQNPQAAIDQLFNLKSQVAVSNDSANENDPLVIGSIIVVIAAIIALMSSQKK